MQSETWASNLRHYAVVIDAHHASFHKAKKAIADLHGLHHDLEISAAQKFAALDREVNELRQALLHQDAGSKVVVDQLAADIRIKNADIEASFAQGRWGELIGQEVQKHAGAFALLAGQASTVNQHVEGQGWVIKELKDEMKDVKDAPSAGGCRKVSQLVQSYSAIVSGLASREWYRGYRAIPHLAFGPNLAFCLEQISRCLRTGC